MIYTFMPFPLSNNELHRDALIGPAVPPRQGEFQSLCELAARRFGMERQFRAIRVCHEAERLLDNRLPGQRGHCRVVSFRDGTLTLAADNPALLQKIQQQAHLLQTDLNRAIDGGPVRKIRLRNT